jgi:hypothetical protein
VAYASDAIAAPNSANGQIRFGKADNVNRNGIVTCGEYPNSDDMSLIQYKSIKRTNEHRTHGCNAHQAAHVRDHLFHLYYQMTGGNIRANTRNGITAHNPIPAFPAPNAAHLGAAPAFRADRGTHWNLAHLLYALAGRVAGNVTHYHFGRADGVQANPPRETNRYRWVPNIINLDFIEDDVCNNIIRFNEWSIRHAGLWNNVP